MMKPFSSYGKRIACFLAAFFVFAAAAEANIVIRSVIVNPSDTVKRKVPFKTYLPKEVKPENVVSMGDLDIAFDPAEGAYYVFKDYELGPKETMSIEVEMEDVWKVPQKEIDFCRGEARALVKNLANTDYLDRANYLSSSIEGKLNQIEFRQKVINPTPGGYISDYRENVKLLESVKVDLAAAKSLMGEARAIAPMLTWKLIIAIVLFLGIVGLVFFFIWQRQIKSLSDLKEDYEGAREAVGVNPLKEQEERRKSEEERKSEIGDIEERLREKPE